MTFEHGGYKVGLLIVSDRAAQDPQYDRCSSVMQEWIQTNMLKSQIVCRAVVADEVPAIQETVTLWLREHDLNLIYTSGGTGFTPRDKTPEAISQLLDRQAPGIIALIMHKSIEITEFAALSRPVAGFIGKCFVVTLPGSPKAVLENLGILKKVLPHALQLASGTDTHKHPVPSLPPSQAPSIDDRLPGSASMKCMCSSDDVDIIDSLVSAELRPRVSKYRMVSSDEAWSIIEKVSERMPVVVLDIAKCSAKDLEYSVLADEVTAKVNVPAYNVSFVDGYAIKCYPECDKFLIAQVSTAGSDNAMDIVNYVLEYSDCVRTNTGAVIPSNADAVVMIENIEAIEYDDSHIEREMTVRNFRSYPGDNIRYQGSDLKKGQVLLRRGHVFSSRGEDLSLLISGQVQVVPVYKKVRIGIMSTGNELFDPQNMEDVTTVRSDKLFDSNRPAIIQLLQSLGISCECVDLGIVKDNRQQLSSSMSQALNSCDILITTGGVSMGEHDYIKPILESDLNATIHFGRLFMKPGKPTTFATIERNGARKYIFGLPGNPVSAQVTCMLFVVPLIKLLNGRSDWRHEMRTVTLNQDIQLDSRPEYARAYMELKEKVFGETTLYQCSATMTGKQTSSRIASMTGFDVLLQLPAASDDCVVLKAGSQVNALLIK